MPRRCARSDTDLAGLIFGEHGDFRALQRRFKRIGKADAVTVQMIGGRLRDDADGAARVDRLAVGAEDFDERDDLSADGEDERRVVHSRAAAYHTGPTRLSGSLDGVLHTRRVRRALNAE